jgi:hypothetical protein
VKNIVPLFKKRTWEIMCQFKRRMCQFELEILCHFSKIEPGELCANWSKECANLGGKCAKLRGKCANLRGKCANLRRESANLRGDCVNFNGKYCATSQSSS